VCSQKEKKNGTYLIEIKKNICLKYIGSSAIELGTEEDNGKKENPYIPDQSFNLGKFTNQIETEKEKE